MPNPKKVQLHPFIEDLHTIHNTIVTDPPEGYIFVGSKTSNLYNLRKSLTKSKIVRFFYHQFLKVFKTTKVIEATQTSPVMEDVDMVFAQGLLYNSPKPWVLYMFDHPACLAGNNYELFLKNKKRIEASLSDPNCKKIICTNYSPIPFLKKHFNSEIVSKATVVDLAIKQQKINKKYNTNKIKILFMGSINNPQDFFIKGGLEVIKVFKKLSKRSDVDLVLRCHIPEEVRPQLEGIPNLTIMDKRVPFEEIIKLYETTDILFMPGHNYSVSSFLEAMSFGIPIVALNTYAVEDFIKNNENGLVLERSNKVKGYLNPGYPTFIRKDAFMNEIKSLDDPELISRLEKALIGLIENPQKIKKMGQNALKVFASKHTISQRNKKFKEIFDQALT